MRVGLKGREQDFGRLCARDGPALIENKQRHTRGAVGHGPKRRCVEGLDLAAVHAMGLRQRRQHQVTANVQALHKESHEQGIQQGFVLVGVLLRRKGQQAVCTPGVGKNGDALVVNRETGTG